MSIKNMHYDYKQKMNKIDTQKYRNLRVPEIDWKLNEAYGIIIKTIAQPRIPNQYGFETSTRTINDLRTLVVENKEVLATEYDTKSYKISLPVDYQFLASSYAIGIKGSCTAELMTNLVQHDDRAEQSDFNRSSFEWREVNFRFYSEGIRLFTDGTFNINKVYLDYIKKPKYMHFAEGAVGGKYKLPSGEELTGYQDCELPIQMHGEIVDLAVLISTGDMSPEYQVKMAKINANN